MAGWDKYFYCANCSRLYRESETRIGEFVVTDPSGGGNHAAHCVHCGDSIIRPQNSISLLIIGFGMFFLAAICLGLVDIRNDAKIRDLVVICPFAGGVCIWVNHHQKFRYKTIYDRWVMQHGTDPEKWPDAPKPD